MLQKLYWVSFCFGLALLQHSSILQAAELTGRVVLLDASSKATTVKDLAVTLDVRDMQTADAAVVSSSRQNSNARGQFHFKQLDNDNRYRYQLSAMHEGATFRSDSLSFGKATKLNTELKLYQHQSDLNQLEAELVHFVVYADAGNALVQIESSWVIHNKSNLAFFSPSGLQIPLPADMITPSLDQQDGIELQGKLWINHQAILPGAKLQQTVQFWLRPWLGRIHLQQKSPLAIGRLATIMFPSNLTASGSGLKSNGQHVVDNQLNQVYLADHRPNMTRLIDIKVAGIASGFTLVHLAMLLACIAIALVWLLWRRRLSQPRLDPLYQQKLLQWQALQAAVAANNLDAATAAPLIKKLQDELIDLKMGVL